MVLLKDLVVIGQGAPNQLKDKRQIKCVCAWSLVDNQFHRIYPVPIKWLRKWDVFDVEVEKNPQDNRENTWKIKNSKQDWNRLNKWINIHDKIKESKRAFLINTIPKTTLGRLIEQRNSFGLIKPEIIDFELEQRNKTTDKQLTLQFGEESLPNLDEGFAIINQCDYKYKPYIKYKCVGDCPCKNQIHRQQIIEWGSYEFMRKNPKKEMQIKENLHLFDKGYDIYLLVGNIHLAPKTYIIIDVLRFKRREEDKK